MTEQNDLAKFPPQTNEAIHGLMWLGFLEQEINYAGHSFLLRTMRGAEELQASLIAKDYIDSFGQVKANAWATVAGALIAVDGESEFYDQLGPSNAVRDKFRYITSQWYWPVAVKLHDEYHNLLRRQTEAIEAIEDLSNRALSNS